MFNINDDIAECCLKGMIIPSDCEFCSMGVQHDDGSVTEWKKVTKDD